MISSNRLNPLRLGDRMLAGAILALALCLMAGAALAQNTWAVGQTVLAEWPANKCWYQGKVAAENKDAREYEISFADGDKGWIPAAKIRADDIAAGSRVWGNWQGGGKLFAGTIRARDGDNVSIDYDDGDKEDTTMAFVCQTEEFLNN